MTLPERVWVRIDNDEIMCAIHNTEHPRPELATLMQAQMWKGATYHEAYLDRAVAEPIIEACLAAYVSVTLQSASEEDVT